MEPAYTLGSDDESISEAEIAEFRASGQFEEQWYLEQYPDVAALGMDPAEHYLWIGRKLGRLPAPPDAQEGLPAHDAREEDKAHTIHRFDEIESLLCEASSRLELFTQPEFTRRLWKQLDRMLPAKGVLSLDVFDTLLLRDGSSELTRFVEIGEGMAGCVHGVSAVDAFIARHLATKASYRAGTAVRGCREGSLAEIHRTASRLLGFGDSASGKFIEVELDYESGRLVVNPAILEYVRRRKALGNAVVLVSDMYMHAEHIGRLLEKLQVSPGLFDGIYSSADHKVSKASGGIFAVVEKAIGREAGRFLHVGDNLRCDFVNPRRSGWRAMHLPLARPEVESRRQDHEQTAARLKAEHDIVLDIAMPHL